MSAGQRPIHVAILMPHGWRGGMANFAVMTANALAAREVGRGFAPTLCLPEGYDRRDLTGISDDVAVIEFTQAQVIGGDIRFANAHRRTGWERLGGKFTLPVESGGRLNIQQADLWLSLTGLYRHGPLLPLRPYVVYAPDFIQRIVPEIYGSADNEWWGINGHQNVTMQHAAAVFATTPRTALDAVDYAGVRPERVRTVPLAASAMFRPVDAAEVAASDSRKRAAERPYFLWVTNGTPHKNHLRAVAALARYYDADAGGLRCIICGPFTAMFDDRAATGHPRNVGDALREERLGDRIEIVGEVAHSRYRALLAGAAFLWHPVLYDNGTFAAIEAAQLGTRTLAANYPQMTHICAEFGIDAMVFDPWDPAEMAAGLAAMTAEVRAGRTRATLQPKADHMAGYVDAVAGLLQGALAGDAALAP